ncbi:hypothetical protein [Roseomonas sp. BN140053]|uniref:hypothetical protein n=1 Tax=Roseomonas sp. BN140053 TaxID=3391898 RepID=UPI0039ED2A28
MILVLEMTVTGTGHVPGNSHLIQMIALALPDQRIEVHGEAVHARELSRDADLAALGRISFHEIALSPHLEGRPHIVSARRFRHELRTIAAVLRRVPKGEPCLLVFASATSTAVVAAVLAARLARRRIGIQVGLHGNLNSITRPRPRNPLRRAFDLRAILGRPIAGLRYLTFEHAIRRKVLELLPAAAAHLDSVPLAVNVSELGTWREVPLRDPVRIGLIGLATEAKGISPFLETARLFKERYGGRVEFFIVGGSPDTPRPGQFRDIAHEVQARHTPREVFLDRLGQLHYVFLPLHPSYYDLSPSGGLLDAVTWLKPVIATRIPLVEDLFAGAGDIGHLCRDVPEMQEALHGILATMDADRYGRQVAALRAAREQRTPAALAASYRAIIRDGFAGLLDVPR